MTWTSDQVLLELVNAGWRVERATTRAPLPESVTLRYPWVPAEVTNFARDLIEVVNPTDTAWWVTGREFAGVGGFAYAWNEWELLSLRAAREDRDEPWAERIASFWNDHFPIAMSVKSAYAYFALHRTSLGVVHGVEPEFEETSTVASSLGEFLSMLPKPDGMLALWI